MCVVAGCNLLQSSHVAAPESVPVNTVKVATAAPQIGDNANPMQISALLSRTHFMQDMVSLLMSTSSAAV